MATFRCTGKLLKEMGEKPKEEPPTSPDDWHANLLRFGPKKIVLFCSSSTLFSCVTPPVTRKQIKDLEAIFWPALVEAMSYERFSDNTIEHCRTKYSEMGVSKTNDRSVLGTMTDYVYHIDALIWDSGGIESCDFGWVSYRLNEIPQVRREFHCASDAFKRSLVRGVG